MTSQPAVARAGRIDQRAAVRALPLGEDRLGETLRYAGDGEQGFVACLVDVDATVDEWLGVDDQRVEQRRQIADHAAAVC